MQVFGPPKTRSTSGIDFDKYDAIPVQARFCSRIFRAQCLWGSGLSLQVDLELSVSGQGFEARVWHEFVRITLSLTLFMIF